MTARKSWRLLETEDDCRSADEVAQLHASAVMRALERAAIPHLSYTEADGYRCTVAIEEAHAEVAVQAIGRLDSQLMACRGDRAPTPRPVDVAKDLSVLRHERKLLLCLATTAIAEKLGLGSALACRLETWRREDGYLQALRDTPWGRFFTPDVMSSDGGEWPPQPAADVIGFPIDAVYTWVDGSDPEWASRRRSAADGRWGTSDIHHTGLTDARFRNRDELRYALRSLAMFAPFIRHVYLVTDDQVPTWLETANARISVVSHRELFNDPSVLPTFNSHAIESQLHRITGLSEHFLYINDDFFFGRTVHPGLFFEANGVTRCFRSKAFIRPGEASSDDPGLEAAAKNGRDLIAAHFGRRVTNKFKHVPQPQTRSLSQEVVSAFASESCATASHRFRSHTDLSIPSSLVHHYGYLSGQAHPGAIRYDYITLSRPDYARERLGKLLRARDRDVFCINDSDAASDREHELGEMVKDFLERYFPIPSEFERT